MYMNVVNFVSLIAELMVMVNHQTFSGQHRHLTDKPKFDQTNLLYIINGEITTGKQMSNPYIISTAIGYYIHGHTLTYCSIKARNCSAVESFTVSEHYQYTVYCVH